VAVCLVIGACGVQPATQAPLVMGDGPDDEPVEVAALKAAYVHEGAGRSTVFVDIAGATDAEIEEIADRLSAELGVIVRHSDEALRDDPDLPALTPYDSKTGEVGVVLRLDDVTPTDSECYEVDVTYARSGLDGGSVSLTLVLESGEWVAQGGEQTAIAKLIE